MADYSYSVNTNSLKGMSIADTAKFCARLGFDGIEWGLPKDGLNAGLLREMKTATEGEGLKVAAWINAGQLWKDDVMRKYSDLVASVGGGMLRVAHPWLAYNFEESLHQRDGFMTLFKRSREGLERLQPLGRQMGIRYVLEMHGGSLCASASACRYLMDGLDPATVGVIYDPANGVSEGFLRPRHSTELLGPYLAYVHAKNLLVRPAGSLMPGPVKRVAWETRTSELECGFIDFVEVFFALKVVGFKGWVSMEEFFRDAPEAQLVRALAFAKECAAAAPSQPEPPFTTFND